MQARATLPHQNVADGVRSDHRELQAGSGLQTYVTAAITGSALTVTAYVNPEIYKYRRFARK